MRTEVINMYEPLYYCLVVDYYKQMFMGKIVYDIFFFHGKNMEVVNLTPISFKLCSMQKY